MHPIQHRCALLLACLLLAACSPPAQPPAALPDATPQATQAIIPAAPVNKLALLPRPTPHEPSPEFPSCEPDLVAAPGLSDPPAAAPDPGLDLEASPALRPLAGSRGLYLGVSSGPGFFELPGYTGLLTRHFNMIAAENAMKWEVVHPGPQRYDFTEADALVAYARAHGLAVYGHALAWDLQQPEWLTALEAAGQTRRDEWIGILCRHIKTVVGRYRGQVYAWDVVNEPFTNEGALRDTLWLRTIGPEYMAMAFQWAREADPQAVLVLNEHFAEGLNVKSQAVYALAQGLVMQGVPIDGVGLQMHVWLGGPPEAGDLRENMRRLAELGLQVHITEMDVRTQYTDEDLRLEYKAQAGQYREALAACLEAANCNVFVVWGLSDRYSWIPHYTGKTDAPLIFDRAGRPKPAFEAVLDLLQTK